MDKVFFHSKIESLLLLLEKLEAILLEHEHNKAMREYLLYAAEKKAEEIVELAVSLNQELLKTKNKNSLSYYDSFIDLKVFKVFLEENLRQLASTAGFRNRLAHDYLDVDSTLALGTMKRMLPQCKLNVGQKLSQSQQAVWHYASDFIVVSKLRPLTS